MKMTTDERFDRLDASMERLQQYLAEFKGDVARLSQYMAEFKGDVARLSQYVAEFKSETTRRFDLVENRMDVLTATVHSIDLRLPPLSKAILDFGTVASRLMRDQGLLKDQVSKLIDPAA
jgi:chromosome segregation ATPase